MINNSEMRRKRSNACSWKNSKKSVQNRKIRCVLVLATSIWWPESYYRRDVGHLCSDSQSIKWFYRRSRETRFKTKLYLKLKKSTIHFKYIITFCALMSFRQLIAIQFRFRFNRYQVNDSNRSQRTLVVLIIELLCIFCVLIQHYVCSLFVSFSLSQNVTHAHEI